MSNNFSWTIQRLHLFFIENYVWCHNPTQKMSAALANLNVKNIFFGKNCSNIMPFSINHGSKRGLNLIMHIMVIKYGEKTGKILFNRSDKMEISKSDIFFCSPFNIRTS